MFQSKYVLGRAARPSGRTGSGLLGAPRHRTLGFPGHFLSSPLSVWDSLRKRLRTAVAAAWHAHPVPSPPHYQYMKLGKEYKRSTFQILFTLKFFWQ